MAILVVVEGSDRKLSPTATALNNQFGVLLKEAMDLREISQHELGPMVGVCQQTVSKWVLGASVPSAAMIRRINVLMPFDRAKFCVMFGFPAEAQE